jgi:hypothetical protein
MPALAGPWPMFSMDYAAIAVLELLQADATLQAVTKGAIYRRHLFVAEGEYPLPCILVACTRVVENARPSSSIKSDASIGVLYCFSQFTKNLDTGVGKDEPSVASLQAYLLSLLPATVVNQKIFERFPELGASGAKQLAVTGEFRRFDPIPINDKTSGAAFAVGVEIDYAQWVRYPSRLAA